MSSDPKHTGYKGKYVNGEWVDLTPQEIAECEANAKAWEEETAKTKWRTDRLYEYPSIEELVVALYDTEDKATIDAKRAAVKAKYPKGAS